MRRYQHDTVTAPVSTSPESVHVDAWMQPQPQPQANWMVRAAAAAVVLIATSGLIPIDPKPPVPPVVTVDRFQPVYRSVTRKRNYPVTSGTVQVGPPVAVTAPPAEFKSTYPDWIARSYPEATYAPPAVSFVQVVQPEQITVDKFKADYPDALQQPFNASLFTVPGHQASPSVSHGAFTPFYFVAPVQFPRPWPAATYVASGAVAPVAPVSAAEIILLDKWNPDYPVSLQRIYPRAAYRTASQPILTTAQESVSVDKFAPVYPDRAPRIYSQATYAASGETFTTNLEAVLLDKWWQPSSQPTYLKRCTELGQSVTDAKLLTQKEQVSVDKFGPDYPSQIARISPASSLIASGPSAQFAVETILLDKWWQPPSQPLRLLPRSPVLDQSVTDPALLTRQEAVSVDKFNPDYPASIARISPSAALVASGRVGPVSPNFSGEIVTLDKWFEPASQPTYLPKRSAQLDQSVTDPKLLTQRESVSIDKFGPSYPEAARRAFPEATYVASGGTFLTNLETVYLDKWWQPVSQPTYVKRCAELGQTVTDARLLTQHEQVSIDKFGPDYPSQIARIPLSAVLAPGPVVPIVAGEIVTLDKWFEPASQPTYLPKRSPDFPQSVIDPRLLTAREAVSVDKFQPDYPSQFWRTPVTWITSLSAPTFTTEFVTLDKWFEPPSQPTRLRQAAAPYQTVIDPRLLTAKEAVSLDKFKPDYPDAISRISSVPVLASAGAVFVVPENVTLDKWYLEQPGPTLVRPRDPGEILVDPRLLTAAEQISIDKFGPDYPVWIIRTPNAAMLVASGAVMQQPIVIPPVQLMRASFASVVLQMAATATVVREMMSTGTVVADMGASGSTTE